MREHGSQSENFVQDVKYPIVLEPLPLVLHGLVAQDIMDRNQAEQNERKVIGTNA